MRRIFAQVRKELTQIVRDRLALTLALLLPLGLLMLLGTAIALTVTDLPIIVQDFDNTPASRDFTDAFRASITFHVVFWPTDRQPQQAFFENKARAALIIPEHFGRDLARGNNTPVQMLVDATDANTAKLVQGYAGEIAANYSGTGGSAASHVPVRADIRLWYNPGRVSKKFYGPGIFVLGISMFPPLLAALAMSREGEQKTILQVYVSNISAHEFLLGKIFAFMLIAIAEWCLSLALLFTYFGLSFAGDPSAFIVATVALGGFLLVFLLSGLIFPVENIPAGLRWISNIVWGKYYIAIVRDALLQGGGWPSMWGNVAVIGAIGSVFYTLAWRKMRRMQLSY
jgi:ABC-2 type transport system permease protein